jgi:two-component system, cell cycle response regulator
VANESQSSAAGNVSGKPRVLIADDSRIVRASLVQHLKDRFDIREVMDGEAAWQAILLDSSIRVVISDLTMPKVDGYELLNRVRSSKVQRIRELPIVIISGEDETADRERAAGIGATDFIRKGVGAAELVARMEVLVRLSSTREALAESQASLESSRTVDTDTELLNLPFFDKQVEKLVSYARRNLSDVAVICVRIELSLPNSNTWDGESDQRIKLVGRAIAASIRLEDLGTRSDKYEFCVATPSSGLSGVLRFAARLRKVLENAETAGPGVEVWTCIGVATLSEELRRSAEELRALAQKRAEKAQQNRSRRIILGAGDGEAGSVELQPVEGSMDINLALALIRTGRAAEVVPHLPRLLQQVAPLLKLVRQQKELQAQPKPAEGGPHDDIQAVPR